MNYQYNGPYDFVQMQSINPQMHPDQFDPMMGQHIKMHKTTKRDILGYLQQLSRATEVIQVDEFETLRARHICKGTKEIRVLEKGIQPVPTSEGVLNVEYFLCSNCGKLILNKQCLEMS